MKLIEKWVNTSLMLRILAGVVIGSVSKARAGVGGRFKTVITLYLVTTLMAAVLSVFASTAFPVAIVLGDVTGADGAVPGTLSDVFRNILKGIMSNPPTESH